MKKGEKILLVLGALLIAAGVFVGVTLGWDYSPSNYAYNDIEFTAADTETAGRENAGPRERCARRRRASHHGKKARPFPAPCRLGR